MMTVKVLLKLFHTIMIRDKVLLLIKISKKNNLNISVAESCTGGLLSSSIIEIPGASDIFNSGFVTYSNIAKIKHLDVNKDIVKKYASMHGEHLQQCRN